MERQRAEKGVAKEQKQREDKRVVLGSMVEKLKQGVLLKKGGTCTTPPPSWRLELPSSSSSLLSYGCDNNNNNNKDTNVQVQEFLNFLPNSTTISARKLCANLWEIQSYQHTPLARMSSPATGIRSRLHRRRRRRHHRRRDNVLEVEKQLAETPDTPSEQPASASSLKRYAASIVQHHLSAERKGSAPQPVSPAGYSSSAEVAPYNPAASPTNSTDFKGMIGESSYNLTISKELLKVLNRIWSLEEQHASNVSAVKALKLELYRSQAQMEELLQEKQMNRHEMENLMKQMTVEKFVRKSREHDRIKAAVQSMQEGLEDERRLRKHSESLHRKLSRELCEVKSSFSGCLRNLEREQKARILLENLCDEFAKGIRDYEQEVHSLRWNSEKGQVKEKSLDRLILHISEAWLDERMQMKLSQSGNDLMERNSIVDKIGFDIETFLHAKRSVDLKKYGYSSPKELKEIYPCHQSMDSFPLNDAMSAPQNMAQEDSIDNEFYEPKRGMQRNKTIEVHQEKKALNSSMRKQVKSEEISEECELQAKICKNISCDDNESCFMQKKSSFEMGEDNNNIVLLMNEEATQVPQEGDNRVGNSSLSSEGGDNDKVYPESVCREDSCVHAALAAPGSPAKLLKSKLIGSDFDKSESSTKLPKGVKENTLMAKLLEARLEGQKSRSRSSRSTP